ncbi:hypothetical protein RD792_017393 [Penstemon davidsonii]|uniref:DNA (cytosine-5-)-methyltransferase n=1 Tax=Penstemon davidsonii TaxID=160366 RepID=A0ABR0CMH6_9LAMI|nr:hypothetical protein RD792_017393 [Penstemon davidsonii]
MPSKRKSGSANKDPAVLPEENRRSKKRNSTAAVESGGVAKEKEISESSCVSASTIDANDVKAKSPTKEENRSDEEEEQKSDSVLREPFSDEEARRRWPNRYKKQSEVVQAKCHYAQAEVDGQVYFLEDDAYVQGEHGKPNFIGKIKEFFQAVDGSEWFVAQWYYRPNDTVIKGCSHLIADEKCIFLSEIKDDNPIECLVKKLRIALIPLKAESDMKETLKATCDFYYDKMYLLPYTSFVSIQEDSLTDKSESDSAVSSVIDATTAEFSEVEWQDSEKTLLDLYSGCGGMSTGLTLGANSCGVKLVTKWAVDFNKYACESLKLNHQETQVRHESAEDFLHLLKEWEKLCTTYLSSEQKGSASEEGNLNDMEDHKSDNSEEDDASEGESDVFEVDQILEICYGDPNGKKSSALHFKIRWKGYGPEEDTWEPLECLSSCEEKLKEFVLSGHKSKILPLPGSVDVICGGPPCQGISGFNRFRNTDEPLQDPKNKQLLVYMDIVAYLRPKFVLMENVVDILRFSGGFLGRYALGSLVSMGYQARMGLMAAGNYGLPQFRMRMFMWGALPTERLPQYPLPTHDVVVRGNIPTEFELNAVAYEEGCKVRLKDALVLQDAISDLPTVENDEKRDKMPYISGAETKFQHFIRLQRDEMPGCLVFDSEVLEHSLFDHRPLCLNQDDYERVCQIPKKKGANFRDLPGVRVRPDNKVEWDPAIERKKVSSGKPLVPDYAMTFVGGTSSKPFGRLWWDETVPTVVTRAEPHNQVILHPSQDRVLTIRENARLQGFPDYYQLLGPIKERYIQVGNAVAVPVARALGFSLAMALKGVSGDGPLLTLPENYPLARDVSSPIM